MLQGIHDFSCIHVHLKVNTHNVTAVSTQWYMTPDTLINAHCFPTFRWLSKLLIKLN